MKSNRKPLTYEYEHNRAYSRYRWASRLIIWIGVLNVVSLLVSIIQFTRGEAEPFFYFCFASNDLIFQLLLLIPNFFLNYRWLYFLIAIIIALASTSGMVLLGVYASQGKRKALWASMIIYLIDSLLIIPCYFVGEYAVSILLMSILHIVFLTIIAIAIYYYNKIIIIAEKYHILKEEGEENEHI